MSAQKYLIVIAGPTASGKTALSVDIANHFNAEILSCDSRQFYREMNIGTAKPDEVELAAAKHHFINSLSVHQNYNAGDYERDALAFLEQYFIKNNVAIMVGGSGLYIKAVCDGVDYFPPVDETFRHELNLQLKSEGLQVLQEELRVSDPVYYEKVDLSNPQRVVRALEICRSSGKPFSSFLGKTKISRPFKSIKTGINFDRPELYDRINRRVDLMMNAGLLKEVESLLSLRKLNALQTVGYREFFDFFDGRISLEEAVELVKRNTRRFAKRQMTWFRKEKNMLWLKAGFNTSDAIALIESQM